MLAKCYLILSDVRYSFAHLYILSDINIKPTLELVPLSPERACAILLRLIVISKLHPLLYLYVTLGSGQANKQ